VLTLNQELRRSQESVLHGAWAGVCCMVHGLVCAAWAGVCCMGWCVLHGAWAGVCCMVVHGLVCAAWCMGWCGLHGAWAGVCCMGWCVLHGLVCAAWCMGWCVLHGSAWAGVCCMVVHGLVCAAWCMGWCVLHGLVLVCAAWAGLYCCCMWCLALQRAPPCPLRHGLGAVHGSLCVGRATVNHKLTFVLACRRLSSDAVVYGNTLGWARLPMRYVCVQQLVLNEMAVLLPCTACACVLHVPVYCMCLCTACACVLHVPVYCMCLCTDGMGGVDCR
jgi:hypothetical protein